MSGLVVGVRWLLSLLVGLGLVLVIGVGKVCGGEGVRSASLVGLSSSVWFVVRNLGLCCSWTPFSTCWGKEGEGRLIGFDGPQL